jgi:hypothetical protein
MPTKEEFFKPKTFDEAWQAYVKKGYNYGEDALENLRFGWQVANVNNQWRAVIEDLCAVSFVSFHPLNPLQTITDLISWEVKTALDPTVSAQAQALIEQGRNEAGKKSVTLDPTRLDDIMSKYCTPDELGLVCHSPHSLVQAVLAEVLVSIHPPNIKVDEG